MIIAYIFLIRYPNAQTAYEELQIEFENIKPLPEAELVNKSKHLQYTAANVGAEYFTELEQDFVFDYYDEELTRLGWKYRFSQKLTHAGFEGKGVY